MPDDGVWADLGCGDNRWLERIPARVRLGIDLRIHEDLRDRRFARASVYRLPFAKESVDALSARFVIEHLVDPVAFFAETSRVLKPGGHLFIHFFILGKSAKLERGLPPISANPDALIHGDNQPAFQTPQGDLPQRGQDGGVDRQAYRLSPKASVVGRADLPAG